MIFETSPTSTNILDDHSLVNTIEASKPLNSPEDSMSFEEFKSEINELHSDVELDHLAVKAVEHQMINQTSFENTKLSYEFAKNPPVLEDAPQQDSPIAKVKL